MTLFWKLKIINEFEYGQKARLKRKNYKMEEEIKDLQEEIKNLDIYLSRVEKRSQGHFHHIDCPICQSKFKSGQEYAEAKCGHYFHVDCLGKWLSQNDTCPTCRKFLDSTKYLDARTKN